MRPSTESPQGARERTRTGLDGLSLAALTVVALAIAIFATYAIISVFGTSEDDAVDLNDAIAPSGSLELGDQAPEMDLELLGGGSTSPAELRGTPVVFNFWSSTCAPCLAEMPDFESVNKELDGTVAFLGVDVTDTEADGLEMLERTGVTYPSARDPRGEVLAAFGGTALPRTVVVDARGEVVAIHNGALSAQELTDALHEADVLG